MQIESAIPPEVAFHRFFQECVDDRVRETYRGKQDLYRLPEPLRLKLTEIQLALNFSLTWSEEAMATLGPRLAFHFDYIEAKISNAIAFRCGSYNFIGVTMPLIEQLLETCERLCSSAQVGELLKTVATHKRQEAMLGGLFMAQLAFVTAHEFGHHAFGHTL